MFSLRKICMKHIAIKLKIDKIDLDKNAISVYVFFERSRFSCLVKQLFG